MLITSKESLFKVKWSEDSSVLLQLSIVRKGEYGKDVWGKLKLIYLGLV